MAMVEGDTFTIPIQGVDYTAKAFSSIEKNVQSLSKSFTVAIESFKVGFDGFSKSTLYVQRLSNSFKIADKDVKKLETSFKSLDTELVINAAATQNVAEAQKEVVQSIGLMTRYFEALSSAVKSVSEGFVTLGNILNVILDPRKWKRLSDILNILGTLARIKGNPALANILLDASDKTDLLGQKLKILEDSSKNFDDRLTSLSQKATLFNTAIDGMKTGLLVVPPLLIGLSTAFTRVKEVEDSFIFSNTKFGKSTTESAQMVSVATSKYAQAGVTLLNLTKAATLAAPILVAMGQAAQESENDFVRFTGKLAILGAIIVSGFAAAVGFAIHSISNFAIVLGKKLMTVMEEYEQVAIKAASATSQFEFTIKGFIKTLGVDAVGSLESWNALTEEIVANTIFTTQQVQKGISLLVKEGAALGLSVIQNTKLLQTASDIAASSGTEIEDVVLRITQGLAGQSQGLLALGINIQETALAHSEYIHESGRLVEQLSAAEKQQLRYNEIMRQSIPIMGASTAQTLTIAGAQAVLNRTLYSLSIRLGNASVFTRLYNVTLNKLASTFLALPAPIVEIIGTFLDFAGVLLLVGGTIAKYTLTISTVVVVYGILNSLIATNIVVQGALNAAFAFTAARIGVTAFAITGLNSALLATALIVKASIIASFKMLAATVMMATTQFLSLTAAMLSNPLFFAGAAIIVGIVATMKALMELRHELDFLFESLETAKNEVGFFAGAFNALKNVISNSFTLVKNLSKIIIEGLVASILGLVQAYNYLRRAMSNSSVETKKIQAEIDFTDKKMTQLRSVIGKTAGEIDEFFSSSAFAASKSSERISNSFDQIAIGAGGVLTKMQELKGIVSGSEAVLNKEIGLADEFDKASLSIDRARLKYNQAIDEFMIGSGDQKEASDKVRTTLEELNTSFIDAAKLRQQTFDKTIAQSEQLRAQLLKISGDSIGAVRFETQAKLAEFDKQVVGIRKLAALTIAEEEKLKNTRILIAKVGESEITKIRTEASDKAMKEADEASKKIRGEFNQYRIEQLAAQNEIVAAQELKNASALDAFDREAVKLRETLKLRKEELELIDKSRDALIEKGKAELERAAIEQKKAEQRDAKASGSIEIFQPQQLETIKAAFGDGASEMASSISGALGGLTTMIGAANIVADAIQGLIDAIPQLLDKIANIFDTLTDLPMRIVSGLYKVIGSISNFLRNFIPNLLKALPMLWKGLMVDLPNAIQDGIFSLLERLPELLAEFIPHLAEGISNFLTMIPRMITKLALFLIRDAPKIAWAIIKVMATELPKAIYNGIVEALAQIGGMLSDLWKGIIPTQKIEDAFNDLGDNISRATSQLFQVLDLNAESRGLDIADRIRKAILSAGGKVASWWDHAWQVLKKIGGDISDAWKKAGADISDTWKKAGGDISDTWKKAGGDLSDTWKKAGGDISDTWKKAGLDISTELNSWGDSLADLFKAAFRFDDAAFIFSDSFWSDLSKSWKDATRFDDEFWVTMADKFEAAFRFDGLDWDGLKDKFESAFRFDGITFEALGEKWREIFSFDDATIKSIQKSFGKILDWDNWEKAWAAVFRFDDLTTKELKETIASWWDTDSIADFFKDLKKELQKVFDGLTIKNLFKELFKVPEDAFKQGTIEKAISTVIPGFDLPFVKFAEGGVVPGRAIVQGNSEINDRVPALLSPGERVLSRTETKAFNEAFPDGVPHFALGGFLGKVVESVQKSDIGKAVGKAGKDISTAGKVATGQTSDLLDVILNPVEAFKNDVMGNLYDMIEKMFVGNAKGFANGGFVDVPQGLVRNGILNAQEGAFASGGQGTDTIAANLTPGEFVVNREATRNNLGLLSFMNDAKAPVQGAGTTTMNVNVVINASTDLSPEQIRREVVPEIEKELRKKSQQGKFIIASAGVRN